MTIEEKRKRDEIPDTPYRGTKYILVTLMPFIAFFLISLPGGIVDTLPGIRDYPNASGREKIHILYAGMARIGGRKPGFYTTPELVYIPGNIEVEQPICAYADMEELEVYDPENLIAWTQMSFNERRLPSDEVSITIRTTPEVAKVIEPYSEIKSLVARPALEICFKRGLLKREAGNMDENHIVSISVRDSAEHEILFYEWIIREIGRKR